MKNVRFAKLIVDVSIFLEYSGEGIVDPDASIELLQQIGSELQKMTDAERASLAKNIRELAPQYGPRSNFVTDLPSNFGISEWRWRVRNRPRRSLHECFLGSSDFCRFCAAYF